VGKAFSIESLVKVLSQQIHVACMGNSGYSSWSIWTQLDSATATKLEYACDFWPL